MNPIFQINVGGAATNPAFQDRIISINVLEHIGFEADKLTITVDDRDSALFMPPIGSNMEVFLGYAPPGPPMQSMGTYIIDTITLEWAPRKIIIEGQSADMARPTLKGQRTLEYKNKKLKDIVKTVADRNGLSAIIGNFSADYSPIFHQTDESDMNLLTRLAQENTAFFKIAGGKLIFKKYDEESFGTTLIPQQVSRAVVRWSSRSNYGKATAYYYDQKSGKRVDVTANIKESGVPVVGGFGGSGTESFVVRGRAQSKDLANEKAKSKAAELARAQARASAITAYGDPGITAGGNLIFNGFRPGIDGTYVIVSVEQKYDSGAYTTHVEADLGGVS